MESFLCKGVNYPLHKLLPDFSQKNFNQAHTQCNHTSALRTEDETTLQKLTYTDVTLSFRFLITAATACKLKNVELYLFKIKDKLTFNNQGELIIKTRLLRDLSFPK